jgi:hypothetical protein
VALLEKRRFLYNHSGDFPQVILIVPSHVPNKLRVNSRKREFYFIICPLYSVDNLLNKSVDAGTASWLYSCNVISKKLLKNFAKSVFGWNKFLAVSFTPVKNYARCY